LIGHDIEVYSTTGAVGAGRACGLKDGDFETFSKKSLQNDHEMTYTPLQNIEPYRKAYHHWKKELDKILENEKYDR
jgi:xylulokinase